MTGILLYDMMQVSKNYLSKNLENKLFELFFDSLAHISNRSDIEKFLFSLISPFEKTMLAKRLGIAILLTKGYRQEEIRKILRVSNETVSRVSMALNYRGEGYKIVIKRALDKERFNEIFGTILKETLSAFSYSNYRKWPGIEAPKASKKTPLG